MVKNKISSVLIFLGVCSLSMMLACARKGPHKPVNAAPPEKGSAGAGNVSFGDVRPLFARHCTPCHNWESDRQLAESKRDRIGAMVSSKSMPKADAVKPITISEREREAIATWASGSKGAPVQQSGPEVIRDAKLALATRCFACHGQQGTSASADYPNLAGHDPAYIVARLQYFMDPQAQGRTMPGQMQTLMKEFGLKPGEDAKTFALLTYLGDFFGRYRLAVTADDLAAVRKKLSAEDKALYGLGKKLVAENQCLACHLQQDFTPTPMTPMIFAQKLGFLKERLAEFKQGQGGMAMPDIVKPIRESDLNAIALYLSLTHPSEGLQ